jgi:hypothetical protein
VVRINIISGILFKATGFKFDPPKATISPSYSGIHRIASMMLVFYVNAVSLVQIIHAGISLRVAQLLSTVRAAETRGEPSCSVRI